MDVTQIRRLAADNQYAAGKVTPGRFSSDPGGGQAKIDTESGEVYQR